jgi:hypothetical protein
LLGNKNEAAKELKRLWAAYGSEMDETRQKEFQKKFQEASGL